MHLHLEAIFDVAEHHYLKPEELRLVSQYVGSLPERIVLYRILRDRELEVMQAVADQLQVVLPQVHPSDLERSLKQALLMLRCCAMGMLLNDETFVNERFVTWVRPTVQLYNTQALDTALCRLLHQHLTQLFTPTQIEYLYPMLRLAQPSVFLAPESRPEFLSESRNGRVVSAVSL